MRSVRTRIRLRRPSHRAEIFGWMKTVGGLQRIRYRGLVRMGWSVT